MEIWKDIIGYEGYYQISSLGKIKSIKRFRGNGKGGYIQKEKYIKGWTNGGYIRVSLCSLLFKQGFFLHRIIAVAFIPNPENKPCINHIDGNKKNNSLNNLEWVTYSENNQHAFDIGLRHGANPKVVIQYDKNGSFIKEYESILLASKETKIIRQSICRHLSGQRPFAGGFVWKLKSGTGQHLSKKN